MWGKHAKKHIREAGTTSLAKGMQVIPLRPATG
jgi:hypothetical protein